MNSSADTLIASLAERLEPVKQAASPFKLFVKWLAASLIYVAMLLCINGLRGNFSAHMHDVHFVTEIGLLLCMVITCGMSAMALSFPDVYQTRSIVLSPLVPTLLFIALMSVGYVNEPSSTPQPPHGLECLLCICFYSFVPAVWMMIMLRRQATTHRNLAGAIALLAASSVGCLALRLSEDTDSTVHLVEWHYFPMIGFAFLGVLLGQKILKW